MAENCDVLLGTLVRSYEMIAVRLTKFKIQCLSNDQNKYYTDWVENVSKRLHLLIGRPLIDSLLFKYTHILLPHACSKPALLLSALSCLNDKQAYAYATIVMCDMKLRTGGYVIESLNTDNPVSEIVPQDELNYFAAARFWFILCEDKVMVEQFQFLSAETRGTWAELLTSIVDAIFVPHKRRWNERNITMPEKIKHAMQVGSTAYFTGNGKLLHDNLNTAVLLTYAQTCHVVARLGKTKYTVEFLDKCVNVSAEELSHAPPPPLLCGLQTYDQLFFFGRTQTLGKVVLKFGDCGQVVGPAKYKRMKQCGVAMLFPALMCIVDCYIAEARTNCPHELHT